MTFIYDYGLDWIAKNNITTADLRLLLVMEGSTAGTERDAEFIASISALEEYDDGSYARKDLAAVTGTLNLTNHREEISVTAPVWTALDAASDQCIGAVLFVQITNDAASRLIAYFDESPTFPFNGVGDDVTLTGNVAGILRLSN